jgi:hypothetical protein
MSPYSLLLLGFVVTSASPSAKPAPEPAPVNLAGEGRSCGLPGGLHFIYRFASRPQLGTVVLKVQVFGPDGVRSTGLKLLGDVGMPQMPREHDSGEKVFQLNRKGDYLLPMDIVMPGGWDVILSFYKGSKRIYRGKLEFKI